MMVALTISTRTKNWVSPSVYIIGYIACDVSEEILGTGVEYSGALTAIQWYQPLNILKYGPGYLRLILFGAFVLYK